MNITEQLFENALLGNKTQITDEMLEYYRKNPGKLDEITNNSLFQIRFLAFFFIIGLILTLGTRTLKFFFEGVWGDFFNDVILDVFSELGIAIFGGAITAYYLEYLKKKQYDENVKFKREIKRRLKEKGQQTSSIHPPQTNS